MPPGGKTQCATRLPCTSLKKAIAFPALVSRVAGWSQGATEAEALENIQDAIREYLTAVEELLQDTPNTEVREVDIAV